MPGGEPEPDVEGSWILAVDVGGTFTDVTLAETRTGRCVSVKVSTTAADPAVGFGDAVSVALLAADLAGSRISRTNHATTIATNAVLERTGARTALICTQGFRDVLEIGRHDGPRRGSLFRWIKPERPIPPDRIFEVDERTAPDGTVERAPDRRQVDEIASRLEALGIESVAICLIDSYAGAANELAVAAMLRERLPSTPLSVSAAIHPAMREYERSMVTALNAFVMPHVGGYLQRLRSTLGEAGIDSQVSIMQSNGGLSSVESIAERPVWTLLSGPAAGVVGATAVAGAAGFRDIITLDVGGTSTDVALVRDGEPEIGDDGRVGDWPLALPMIDVHAVGAGGGSIAGVDGAGSIGVGPRSAGSRPGPACYGLGGTDPTVTDALLVLGRIPDRLAGGTVQLDPGAAMTAIQSCLAGPLGIDPYRAAQGVVEIAEDNMASAIRLISTERGHDPRSYTLVAGGGAGPSHAAGIASLLGIDTILVPPVPGVLSTVGLLTTSLRRDLVRVQVHRLDDLEPAELQGIFDELEAEADAWLAKEGVVPEARDHAWSLALRYPEQPTELVVAWPGAPHVDATGLERVRVAFHERHRARYGYDLRDRAVELVNVRVRATSSAPTLEAAPHWDAPATSGHGSADAPRARSVYLGRDDGFADVPVIGRAAVVERHPRQGPLVIEQDDTTIFVPSRATVSALPGGSLLLSLDAPPRRAAR